MYIELAQHIGISCKKRNDIKSDIHVYGITAKTQEAFTIVTLKYRD